MNRTLTLLLALAMAAHSLAGCCCHHAHAAGANQDTACSHAEHGCHAERGSHADEHDRSTPPAQPCGEQECVFVRGETGPGLDLVLLRTLDQVVALVDCTRVEMIGGSYATASETIDIAPPARLHLLNQILLI